MIDQNGTLEPIDIALRTTETLSMDGIGMLCFCFSGGRVEDYHQILRTSPKDDEQRPAVGAEYVYK